MMMKMMMKMMMLVGFALAFAGTVGIFHSDGVFVYAVEKALDDAEGDETADIDPFDRGAVLDAEAFDALALFERAV